MSRSFRFSVPSGSGLDASAAKRLSTYLETKLQQPCVVAPIDGYDAIAASLMSGTSDAAWAPPLVCARLEQAGVPVSLRCIRGGTSSYRAAIVVRSTTDISLENVGRQRAVWTESSSIAGHRLPAAWLKARRRGVEPLEPDLFAGSYRGALEAVLEGQGGVASVFAPSVRLAGEPVTGLQEIWPERASWFRVLALTDEAPNDGVATAKTLRREVRKALSDALMALNASVYGETLLYECFRAERFEVAPAGSYRALY